SFKPWDKTKLSFHGPDHGWEYEDEEVDSYGERG
ncbi:unnamed protein product, partial [Rotaria socialis]